ncbi:ABC transporter permease [Azorhizobium oxalatiphilum]|uniref:ABC transporter permease n=1 Tax=Azorhizobium oxalatiphilum TaxID=980631 RepID=A0A917BW73_9HYPH|nr:ABC transporter permease [Azorhizobium oxalatiphilum]GGF58527.1 ABC transporter permease [Azorhizobium oxalatiphilum]
MSVSGVALPDARVLRYLGVRVLQVIPTILAIVVLNFFFLRLAPGDLAEVIAGEAGSASPEYMAILRQQFGLDQSIWVQFTKYLTELAQLNLGYSFRNSLPVLDLIVSRAPNTALLMLSSLLIAVVLGVLFGAISAQWRGKWPDGVISALSTVGFATPLFWVGLMLIVLFSVELRWLPAGGMQDLEHSYTGFAHMLDVARHMVLPVFSLAFFYIAIYTRLTRSAMLEVQELDFVRTARAKGLNPLPVTLRHVLRNALLPIVTMTGLQLGALLSGSVVIETVFAWPGMGRLAFDAVFQRDINLLLGVLFFSSFLVIVSNLVTDLVYALLDPRIDIR